MSREAERLEVYRRSVIIFVTVVILILSFLIIRPFLVAILSAGVLAYIFYPLYLWFLKHIPKYLPNKNVASLITCGIILLLVLVPLSFALTVLSYEIRNGYLFLQDFIQSSRPFANLPPILKPWVDLSQLKEASGNIMLQIFEFLQGVVKGIPNIALQIFITIFSTYYFLKHGKDLYRFFADLVPLSEQRYRQILSRVDDLCRGMIFGQIIVGFIQGFLAWLGFVLLAVPNPVLFGFLTAIISIIPLLGAVLVWLPIVVYLFFQGWLTGVYWKGIALLLYGTLVISTVDNILKPKIVGEHAKIHPLIILFGMLGGISLFGIPGILIGPLILAIFDVVIEIYKEAL
ncbi:MAG: AI-2E family transporter [Candidatus Margulisiibacteriota bacterium]